MLLISSTAIDYSIVDNPPLGNSNQIISTFEQVEILFSLENYYRIDSLKALSDPFITNIYYDTLRMRGHFSFSAEKINKDTIINIKVEIFSNFKYDTLLFEIPVISEIDSISIISDNSVINFKLFVNSPLNLFFKRFIKITHYPSKYDTLLLLDSNQNSLYSFVQKKFSGLYFIQLFVEINDSLIEIENNMKTFFDPTDDMYDNIIILDIEANKSSLEFLKIITHFFNKNSTLFLPLSALEKHSFDNRLDRIFNSNIYVLFQSEYLLEYENLFYNYLNNLPANVNILLFGKKTIKSFANSSQLSSYLERNSIKINENTYSLTGQLTGKINITDELINFSNILSINAPDTIISCENFPIIVRNNNIIISNLDISYFKDIDILINYLKDSEILIPEDSVIVPIIIEKAFPNPIGVNGTTIFFNVLSPGEISITITDISGREICPIFSGGINNGNYQFYWNGKDIDNNILPKGIYFITSIYKNNDDIFKLSHKLLLF